MKDLKLAYNLQYDLENDKILRIIPPDLEQTKNIIYMCSENQVLSLNTVSNKIEIICEVENIIIGAEYLSLNDEICLALNSGEVLTCNIQTKTLKEVCFCDNGLTSMVWSPAQEVVLFSTRINTIVIMTCYFDPISEVMLNESNSFGDGEFVTVGWGSKETQFHGSEGKKAATEKKHTESDLKSSLKNDIVTSWRGDGELFVVSYVENSDRIFKVYNKEGMLQYTVEKFIDIGDCVSWRPSGNWIAVPNRFPNKYVIGLFEKNGLRHREIILPFQFDDQYVTSLKWNNDSDIIAVETINHKNKSSNLYLYTTSNYHWYLKQHLKFSCKIADLVWDIGLNEGKTIHILLENNQLHVYRWYFSTTISPGYNQCNQFVATVIDGSRLYLTDFRNKVIPPPMSTFKLENSNNINISGFLQNNKMSCDNPICEFFVLDSDNALSFYETAFEKLQTINVLNSVNLKQKYEMELVEMISHCLWINPSDFIYCQQNKSNTDIILVKISAMNKICSKLRIPEIIRNIIFISDNEFCIVLKNSETYLINILDNELRRGKQLDDIKCSDYNDAFVYENEIKLISLNANFDLTINNTIISSDVTSYFITENHLVFTQLNCLKFYQWKNGKIIDQRKIERGGKLIAIISQDSKVILQMPRGNLEVVHPRVLSLKIIGDLLDKHHYCKAMDLIRKQRINLNIIFDHNPKLFMQNLNEFLSQVTNPQWLNLFLSDLQNEDFTQTLYSSNYETGIREFPDNFAIENKIEFICKSLCEEMTRQNNERFFLPILTTYVKIGDLETPLKIIWSQKVEDSNNKPQRINGEKSKSDEAMQYILYLVDVNELFNVALGLYDFSIVLYVASKSQKDPKEYVSFLNNIKQYEENYRKFKIDVHLKRYEKALHHVSSYGVDSKEFAEAFELIEKHQLHTKALEIFESYPECYAKICLSFADYLRTKAKHESASIMYERAGHISQAIQSAKHILDWRRCLMLTALLHPNKEEELIKISLFMVSALEENGKHEDASNLLMFNLKYIEKALFCMLRGRLYLKAIYEARLRLPNFIEIHLIQHISSYSEELQSNISSNYELYKKHKTRLLDVRKLKSKIENEQVFGEIDESDLISETTSVNSSKYTEGSKGTGKTFRSSKNRRKHERKLLNLKEGSPFEEIALIDALYNLVLKISDLKLHVHETCIALIELRKDNLARMVHSSYKNVLDYVKNSLDEIWITEMQTTQPQIVGANIDYVQFQNQQHYALLSPQKRFKPEITAINLEHDILNC